MQITAGLAKLRTQINKLERRIHNLDMSEVDPKELHAAIESLNALKSRYKEMEEAHNKKKESKETPKAEIPVESDKLPILPQYSKEPLEPMQQPMYGQNPEHKKADEELPVEPKHEEKPMIMRFPNRPPRRMPKHHVVDVPAPTEKPQEKESDVNKFAIHDVVEPTRGTPGSRGSVMGHDEANDMVYVAWNSGALKDSHGYGAYSAKDLRKAASLDKQAELMAVWTVDKVVTSFNEETQDWSGKQRDFGIVEKGSISASSAEEAAKKIQERLGLEYPFEKFDEMYSDTIWFSTNQTEDDNGYPDENGKWLADYSLSLQLYKPHKEKEPIGNPEELHPGTASKDDSNVTKEAATTKSVVDAFVNRTNPNAKVSNLYIIDRGDHWDLVNYQTVIAQHFGDRIAVSNKVYSVTTTKIQSQIAYMASAAGIPTVDMATGKPINQDQKRERATDFRKLDFGEPYERISAQAAGEEDSWMPDEPSDEDIFISDDHGKTHAWYLNKPIASLENDDWDAFFGQIIGWMESNKYSPTVWSISDHGNVDVDNSFYEFAKNHHLEQEKPALDTVSSVDTEAGHRAFDVFLNGKEIDTIFYNDRDSIDEEEVRNSLINHDGYDANIIVKERKPRRGRFERPSNDEQWDMLTGSLDKKAHVVEEDGKWYVYNHDKSKKLSKGYGSKEQANKRLRQIEYFKHQGSLKIQATSWHVLGNGDLEITLDPADAKRMDINPEELDSDNAMYDLFESVTSNGLSWVAPEAIGAMTDAPILSDSPSLDDGSADPEANYWWYPNYAVESPARELIEKGRVIFKKAAQQKEAGKYTGDMDKDLKVLLPHIVADGVAGQDRDLSDWLVERARQIYKHNPEWGKKVARENDAARDFLAQFMAHWMQAKQKNPNLSNEASLKTAFIQKPVSEIQTADEARQLAIDWQHSQSQQALSYGELAEWDSYFHQLTEKFPELAEEFTENGITAASKTADKVCYDCQTSPKMDCKTCGGSGWIKEKKAATENKIPLNVFDGTFYAIETSGKPDVPHGYAIFNGQGQQVMVVTTQQPITQERLESIVHDEYGKRELVRATLTTDHEAFKKGTSFIVSGINRTKKQLRVKADKEHIWLPMEKVAETVNLEQHIQQMKDRMNHTQETLQQAVTTEANVEVEADEPMPDTPLADPNEKWTWDAIKRKWFITKLQ